MEKNPCNPPPPLRAPLHDQFPLSPTPISSFLSFAFLRHRSFCSSYTSYMFQAFKVRYNHGHPLISTHQCVVPILRFLQMWVTQRWGQKEHWPLHFPLPVWRGHVKVQLRMLCQRVSSAQVTLLQVAGLLMTKLPFCVLTVKIQCLFFHR